MFMLLKSLIDDCEDLLDNNELDDWNNMMFQSLVECFNVIAHLVKNERGLPYFDLKANWKLLKKHKFDYALINVQEWYEQCISSYDG